MARPAHRLIALGLWVESRLLMAASFVAAVITLTPLLSDALTQSTLHRCNRADARRRNDAE